ncbi:MAG: HEAT repeat domain-containing protein [Armatimonadota bacterium]|nr:MAG: HEAT repeat domain-containing protein [Armatimonadota bacterium]
MKGRRWYRMALAAAAVSAQGVSSVAAAPSPQEEYLEELASSTARMAQVSLERASVAGSGDLTLELAPAQETWPLFAPVTVFVRLTNAGTQPAEGYYQLNEDSARLFLYIARAGGQFVPLLSLAALRAQMNDMMFPRGLLPPGNAITARVTLLYDYVTRDYAFPLAGTYRVKAVFAYDLGYENVVSSNVADIKIVSADWQDTQVVPLVEGQEQANVLQRESADADAVAKLRTVVEMCPDSEYALYARTPLSWPPGASYAREAPAADRTLGPRHRAVLEEAVATLRDASQTTYMRMGAALRLGEQLGHKDAMPALVSAINDSAAPREVRFAAVIALSQIPDPSAVEALLDVVTAHPEPALRERARKQLVHMGVPVGPVHPPAGWELRKETGTWVPRAAGNADVIVTDVKSAQ